MEVEGEEDMGLKNIIQRQKAFVKSGLKRTWKNVEVLFAGLLVSMFVLYVYHDSGLSYGYAVFGMWLCCFIFVFIGMAGD